MSDMKNDLGRLGSKTRAFLEQDHGLHIDGKVVAGAGSFEVHDPTTGAVIATAAEASAEHVDAAVMAAKSALAGAWAKMRPIEREQCLLNLSRLLGENGDELSEIGAMESGRLLGNTMGIDVGYSQLVLNYMAGWATKIEGTTHNLSIPYIPDGEFDGFTFREPVGVVAAIVPWNVALGIAIWKLAPALAAGCTIVLKPAPQTPLTALRLAELCLEAGIPEGVVNVVTGSDGEVGAAMVRHPDVSKVAFTGSTETGRIIAQSAAASFKKVSLELGGKSPFMVMEDADIDAVIPAAAWGIFGNHGQNCCAGSRLYVHEKHYERVVEGVAEIAQSIRMGSPLLENTEMGPLSSIAHRDRVLDLIQAGTTQGARLVTGGGAPDASGAYVQPTILADVTSDMTPVKTEIFGPVLVAASFSSEEEALQLANASEYGLGASVWSKDIGCVRRMTRGIQAGSIWVNVHNALDMALPFGGWKNSGVGFDLGKEAVLAHTKIKAAVHHYL